MFHKLLLFDTINFPFAKGVFAHAEKYRFFVKETGERMRTLSLAAAGEKEVISVGMVAEPDDFGKWKIYCIEKE